MKNILALTLALFSGAAAAKELPPVPANCAESVADLGYCSAVHAPTFKGPIGMEFYVVVDKANYPTVDSIINRYLAFDYWPEFSKSTSTEALLFNKSVAMPSFSDKQETTIHPHYYDYRIKTPIGYIKVRGLTHNFTVEPHQGAIKSLEFIAQNSGPQNVPEGEKPLEGAEGVQFQTGSVHAVDCASSSYAFCSEEQFLLIYETKLQPDIDILPKVAAASIQSAIEALLVGMLFNDVQLPDNNVHVKI